jgi:hypothetical protein
MLAAEGCSGSMYECRYAGLNLGGGPVASLSAAKAAAAAAALRAAVPIPDGLLFCAKKGPKPF